MPDFQAAECKDHHERKIGKLTRFHRYCFYADLEIPKSAFFFSRRELAELLRFDRLARPCKILKLFFPKSGEFRRDDSLCRSGGIGRRAWFRSMYPQGCGGSSPFFGTRFILAASFIHCSFGVNAWRVMV